MNGLRNELFRLREDDPNVKQVFDTYVEIERVYREALELMGINSEYTLEPMSSAEVKISLDSNPSTADD